MDIIKKLAAIIKDFTEVVCLVLPMQSRNYLILRQNRLFDSIKIDVINADEMSEKNNMNLLHISRG
jgi:hypothetical protein